LEKGSDWDLLIVVNKELARNEKMKFSHLIRNELAEEYNSMRRYNKLAR